MAWVVVACAGSASAQLSFTNVTSAVGLAGAGKALVMAAGDFNNDGWQDLFVGSDNNTPDKLLINDGTGMFTDEAAAWGLLDAHDAHSVTVGDFNNDGWLDLYVTSTGAANVPGMHRLYKNNAGTGFTDIAVSAGVNMTNTVNPEPEPSHGTGCIFGDYDLDGDLDIVVADWASENNGKDVGGDRLFRNNGDETFTDVTAGSGLFLGNDRSFTPAWVDINGDRYPELLWVGDFQTSKIYLNNTDGTFTDITATAGVGLDGNGMGQAIGDFDNDGDFDWYVQSIWTLFPFGNVPGDGNMLYVNQGNGTFVESAAAAGAKDGGWGWGAAFADFDLDGNLDLMANNGWVAPNGATGLTEWLGEQKYLWMNNGDSTFTESSAAVGINYTNSGRGVVCFDANNDGDVEIVLLSQNDECAFYRCEMPTGAQMNAAYLRVFIDTSASGGKLAPNGYNTVVRATVGATTHSRFINGVCSHRSQHELSAHFGLGSAATVDSLKIEWANGRVTTLNNVACDQTITVKYCPADADGNASLDIFDFFAFINEFNTMNLNADCDGSGTLDFFDFTCFQNAFGVGCP